MMCVGLDNVRMFAFGIDLRVRVIHVNIFALDSSEALLSAGLN